MVQLAGFVYDSAGVALSTGVTVNIYARNTVTPVVVSPTVNASGYWQATGVAEGRYDVEIVNGTTTRRIKYDDELQVQRVEAAVLQVRNPANTFIYDVVPGAITANRTLNLPVITGTDTVAVLSLAQTFTTGVKTFNSSILAIRNPADTFSYTVVASAITAARNLTVPLITADDTLAVLGLAQTFSASNTFSATAAFTATSPFSVANGQTLTFSVTAQTVGAATLTIPNFASVNDTFVFSTLAQTLSNKTLASPVFSGSTSGTYTLGGTVTINAFTLGGTISGGGQQLNNIIIGTTTPLAGTFSTISAISSTTIGGAGAPTPTIQSQRTSSTSVWALVNTTASNSNDLIDFLKSRGASISSPTAIVTGDLMGQIRHWGYDGTTWQVSADWYTSSTGTIAAGQVPSYQVWRTTTSGGTLTNAFWLDAAQIGYLKTLQIGGTLGTSTTGNQFNTATQGGASTTMYIGNASINVTSDARVKSNVVSFSGDALALIDQLEAVEYDQHEHRPFGDVEHYVGLTAQNVYRVAPWAVNTQGGADCPACLNARPCNKHLPWQVKHELLAGLFVKAIQQLRRAV